MDLDIQERKRVDSTLFKFQVKSSGQTHIITQYSLLQQKYLVVEESRKIDSIDGIGPMRLVRNKMTHAAFK